MVNITNSKFSRNNEVRIETRKASIPERIFLAERQAQELRDRLKRITLQENQQRDMDELNQMDKIMEDINLSIDVLHEICDNSNQYPLVSTDELHQLILDLEDAMSMDWISENIQFFTKIKASVINCICRTNLSRRLLKPLEEVIKSMDKIIQMAEQP